MSTGLVVMDPTGESAPAARTPLPLPASVAGKVVGLLDISKPRGDVFLDHVEGKLKAAGAEVRRYSKPTFTRPAPAALRQQIAEECDLVLEALAD